MGKNILYVGNLNSDRGPDVPFLDLNGTKYISRGDKLRAEQKIISGKYDGVIINNLGIVSFSTHFQETSRNSMHGVLVAKTAKEKGLPVLCLSNGESPEILEEMKKYATVIPGGERLNKIDFAKNFYLLFGP